MRPRLTATTVCVSDTGSVRARNEDRFFAGPHFFGVADGMGGHTLGDVAAQYAVDMLGGALGDLERASGEAEEEAVISAALARAATSITEHVDGEFLNTQTLVADIGPTAGTTVAGVYLGRAPLIFHVGDSRVYRYRDGDLRRLTRDHSLVQEMVDAGQITDAEAHVHPQKNIITRAVGTYGPPEVDFSPAMLAEGDFVLCCTDGLHDELTDYEIAMILLKAVNMDEAVHLLRDEALAAGGHDNVTIVLAHMGYEH
ncbi:PP2C family protein-serine/threonine phosphatase [Trueperella abortisuis]|uniref:PP2C family protein-serine/threonine phosphatase n=1 Tax=Trueperella abortisuis TaxID=445930 RepID=UPI002893012E|nr:protein phosphatase 2C domain-containing protein [Trueperella abortisuis]